MANVNLPAKTLVNLLTASGISSTAQADVTPLDDEFVRIYFTSEEPDITSGDYLPCRWPAKTRKHRDDPGCWAYAQIASRVDIQES